MNDQQARTEFDVGRSLEGVDDQGQVGKQESAQRGIGNIAGDDEEKPRRSAAERAAHREIAVFGEGGQSLREAAGKLGVEDRLHDASATTARVRMSSEA